MVRRVLPALAARTVGPFIFFDHIGPATLVPGKGLDVRPHPHIGLATVTYLFDGAIMHRDSVGSVQKIVPGDVNWMTAGRGIVHSERTPDEERANGQSMHGIQTWVALPVASEDVEPSFEHHAAATLPQIERVHQQSGRGSAPQRRRVSRQDGQRDHEGHQAVFRGESAAREEPHDLIDARRAEASQRLREPQRAADTNRCAIRPPNTFTASPAMTSAAPATSIALMPSSRNSAADASPITGTSSENGATCPAG